MLRDGRMYDKAYDDNADVCFGVLRLLVEFFWEFRFMQKNKIGL
jgi:hypothetical protein